MNSAARAVATDAVVLKGSVNPRRGSMSRRRDLRPRAERTRQTPSQAAAGVSLLSSGLSVAPFGLAGLQSRVSDNAMIAKPEPRRFPTAP
jgi:hypothetical protein